MANRIELMGRATAKLHFTVEWNGGGGKRYDSEGKGRGRWQRGRVRTWKGSDQGRDVDLLD